MRKWPWLFALACGAAGCQLIAGDYEMVPDEPAPLASVCSPQEQRCNGQFLLACTSDGSDWVLRDTCATSDLCDSENGLCERCERGELRCDGSTRQECKATGDGWEEREICSAAGMCNPTYCGTCAPGEYACRGTGDAAGRELWECGPDSTWSIQVATCATAGLCDLSIDASRGAATWAEKCTDPLCPTPGAYRCTGQALERCRQDLTGWERVDTCASEALCAIAVANAGLGMGDVDMCPPGCPSAGAFLCEGMTLRTCREDLTGWDEVMTCEPGTECDPVQGGCAERCEPGHYQCNAETLRLCSAERSWQELERCASAALCTTAADGLSGACNAPGCPAAGEFNCQGADLHQCRDDLLGWEFVESCASAELCSALDRRCHPPVCAPAELRCFGAELRSCAASLDDWEIIATCGEGEFCDNSAADPGCKLECPSPTRCNGTELEHCTPNGWVHQANCATNELCSCTLDGSCALDPGTDGCGVPVCGGSKPEYQCQGATLEHCRDDRNGWETAATCGSTALCYPGTAPLYEGGYCAVCPTAGEVRCGGGNGAPRLETCSADRKSWNITQNCSAAYGCVDDGADDYCAVCNTGQTRCSGSRPERCRADRAGWEAAGANCASSALCDAGTGTCVTPTCSAGQRRCNGAQPQVCNGDRTGWNNSGNACSTVALCNTASGSCTTAACAVGERRCNGSQPQICNADRTGFVNDGTACATAALCSSGSCSAPACAVGERRCDDEQPQLCNSNRNGWNDSGAACASAALCSEGTCQAPVCATGEVRCSGAQPEICRADRTGYQSNGAACATTALCSGGECQAPACAPGDYDCDDEVLLACNAGRTGFEEADTCASAALCDAEAGMCRAPVCEAGAYRCNEAALERCNGDGTGWTVEETCGSSALCDVANRECDECAPGSFDCTSEDVLRECDEDGRWDEIAECDVGLCDASLGMCLDPPPDEEAED
ncbi:MAG TPA: hypothetical protein VGK73_28775 [Polyangiaceae bacterium]